MKFSLEEKKAICALFDKCDVAMLKISIHDGIKHIDKVYLDGKYYDIPSKDLGIKQAPTLVVVKDGKLEKYSNVSDIKKYLGSKECVTA